MLGTQGVLLILASRLVLGGVLGTRKEAAPSGQFGLYAYGKGIGGAQVFYSRDVAFIGDQTQMDDDEAAPVAFTTGPNNALVGNPDMNSTRVFHPSWSDRAFFVPPPTSSSHRVGFTGRTAPPDVDADTSGFVFYGATALHQDADSTLHGLWYAVPAAPSGGAVWALRWNATGDAGDGHVSVTLRSVAPAKPFGSA
ncbi:hypothetical protein F4802DRAFT_602293 [Xylaria palmicola]|nr:hypothetical protein F4802DRAFT_602293 [Xylaria palmicola]